MFETYNIGGHNEKQNIEIIHIILDTLREKLDDSDERKSHINEELITYVEDRKGHDRRYAIAPDKIKAEVGEAEAQFLYAWALSMGSAPGKHNPAVAFDNAKRSAGQGFELAYRLV